MAIPEINALLLDSLAAAGSPSMATNNCRRARRVVQAPLRARACSEGAGVVVFSACGDFSPFLVVLHFFFSAFHLHALSAEHDASSLCGRQGSDGLQATSNRVIPTIVKPPFIVVTPRLNAAVAGYNTRDNNDPPAREPRWPPVPARAWHRREGN